MGGQQGELSGPDLAQGVLGSELADGAMLVGHTGGEAVLLARRGDEVFAVGATCTHYRGPLGEGLLVGDTVRCPWHHACFSLRSGEALRAPALDPIPCWRVERQGDRLVVSERLAPSTRRAHVTAPASVVILGAGAAGNFAAETLRREGFAGSITMIGAEPSLPCDRPNLSKDYLAGDAPEEWIPLRTREFYELQRIDLALGVRAASLDVAGRRVVLADGAVHRFDALLLATGAEPRLPALPGGNLPHVHVLRSLADSRAIVAGAAGARRAVVLGASFIALEAAASLRARGLEVHLVAPDALPLEHLLGREVGEALRRLHAAHGVVFHLGKTPGAIDERAVTLTTGEALPADLVVAGLGVRPSVELAEKAGLAVDHGILVDELLETSAPGIFAAGDVARWPDPRSGARIRAEHWVVAGRQGQVAARNLLGQRVPFDAVPFFWSAHYDVTLSYVGHGEGWDEVRVAGDLDARDATVTYLRAGKPLAVATIGRDRQSLAAEAAMESGDPAALRALLEL